MAMQDRIEARLREVFQPSFLEVIDESERHIGHAGYQDGGESHFRVTLRSARFAGLSRLDRHRAVHNALGPEIVGAIRIVALNLDP